MYSLLWSFFLLYDLFIDLHVYAFILTQISWSHNWYTCITFLVTEMCFTSFFKCNYLILQMLFSLFRIFNFWLTVLLERTQWWKFFLTDGHGFLILAVGMGTEINSDWIINWKHIMNFTWLCIGKLGFHSSDVLELCKLQEPEVQKGFVVMMLRKLLLLYGV